MGHDRDLPGTGKADSGLHSRTSRWDDSNSCIVDPTRFKVTVARDHESRRRPYFCEVRSQSTRRNVRFVCE